MTSHTPAPSGNGGLPGRSSARVTRPPSHGSSSLKVRHASPSPAALRVAHGRASPIKRRAALRKTLAPESHPRPRRGQAELHPRGCCPCFVNATALQCRLPRAPADCPSGRFSLSGVSPWCCCLLRCLFLCFAVVVSSSSMFFCFAVFFCCFRRLVCLASGWRDASPWFCVLEFRFFGRVRVPDHGCVWLGFQCFPFRQSF